MSAPVSRYPAYRHSGVEWLGEIPTEWRLSKLAHAYPQMGSGTTPPSESERWYGGPTPWITTGELREREIYSTSKTVTSEALAQFSALRLFPKGSLAIAMYGATIGRLGILGVPATTNQACCVLPSSGELENRYVYYWFQAVRDDIINLASGGGQPNISQAVVASLRVSAPRTLEEQTQIAKFLDYETAKIDALIEKQQQLIALLKEKRQAVISHAVTKGLDPSAPMKDSGVEWLGKVPAHWEITRLGYLASVGNGSTPSRSVAEYWRAGSTDGVAWLNSTKINDGEILQAEQFVSKRAAQECHLPLCHPGYVLVAITGEGQTRGRAALLQTDATINQHLSYVAPDRRRIEPRFLWRQLQARYDWLRYESAGGGSTRAALTCEFLRGVPVCVPPKDEQIRLLSALETRARAMDETAEKASLSLDLLQERRTALISAAVTGKIDVRGWKPPPGSAPDSPSPEKDQVA